VGQEGRAVREFTVPTAATTVDSATLTDAVWHNAEQAPTVVQYAVRAAGRWVDVSCGQFRDEVAGLARGLIAAGIGPGDRVGLLSRTRYEWTLIDYAIWAAGAVTVPIYETSSAEQVAWILADSGAVGCFVESAPHRAALDDLHSQLPELTHVWQIDGDEPAVATLVESGFSIDPETVTARRVATRPGDLATIIYTSGTTGRPKGCLLSHRNLLADAGGAIAIFGDLIHPAARTLLFLPLAHSFARLIQIATVQARVATGHTPDVRDLMRDLGEFRPTFLLAVPRVFEKVYNAARQRAHADGRGAIFDRAEQTAIAYSQAEGRPGLLLSTRHRLFDKLVYSKLRAALGGRCTACISGGAPLGERLAHFFRGIGFTVFEGYGLTETSPAAAANRPGAIRIGTVGRPLPGVTVRIADDGEILVRGDIVFGGYWHDAEASAEVLDADGFFRTGDLGELSADGYLAITGRKKEIIVTAGGKNVAPTVLEDRLRAHPLISQCIVVGDRRPFIAALVTIDPDAFPAWRAAAGKAAGATVADLTGDEDLRGEVRKAVDEANLAVSKAEAIRAFRILPRDFTEATGELTPSMKVRRTVVMKEYADEIAAIYGG
jgi:long-chain acyl-CoA synthetase